MGSGGWRRSGGRWAWLCLASFPVVLLPVAQAQDPQAPETEVLPPAAPPPLRSWGSDHQWRSTGLVRPILSVQVTAQGSRLAMAADGELLRSASGGPWRRVQAGVNGPGEEISQDENILLEAEATFDELIDDSQPDVEEVEQDPTGGEDLFSDQVEELQSFEAPELEVDLADEVEVALIDLEARQEDEAPSAEGSLWASQDRVELVLAGRSDGLWRSVDDGRSWVKVDEAQGLRAFVELVDGRIIAGGPGGLFESSDDGRSWSSERDNLGERAVWGLDAVGEALVAATDEGLQHSIDGLRWSAMAVPIERVRGVLADPNWPGGLWFWTPDGLYRSDDLGQTSRLAGRNPMPGTRALSRIATTGQLILGGSDGAWESLDGGLTWSPLPLGLADPDLQSVATWFDVVLAAGPRGVQQLGRRASQADPAATGEAEGALRPRRDPPLAKVVGQALERKGLDLDDMTLGNTVILTQFMPRLVVDGYYGISRYRDTVYDSLRTSEGKDPDYGFEVALCWGACSGTYSSYDVSDDPYDVAVEASELAVEELAVIDGEVYDLSDEGSLPSVAANIAQRASTYRTEVAQVVTAAWGTRQSLLAESAQMASLPLGEQVTHLLLLDELDARLDAYTDGWFTRTRDLASDAPPASSP